jgi:hypothetical protein
MFDLSFLQFGTSDLKPVKETEKMVHVANPKSRNKKKRTKGKKQKGMV